MLIDFTVENFRSIHTPVTLSSIAQGRTGQPKRNHRRGIVPDDDIAQPRRAENRAFELLPVIAVFGANASGKSNVLQSLNLLISFMVNGGSVGDSESLISIFVPYLLSVDSRERACKFRLRILLGGDLLAYHLAADQTMVHHERLAYVSTKGKRESVLFDRTWDKLNSNYVWRFSKQLAKKHVALQQSIVPSEPLLPLLVNEPDVDVLAGLSAWLKGRWPGVSLGEEDLDDKYVRTWLLHIEPSWLPEISTILRRFDTGLQDIEFVRPNADAPEIELVARHTVDDGTFVRWSFGIESAGTQRLLHLATRILMAFKNGSFMLIDELGSHFHPNITREIVRMFQDPKTNPKRAQLIFTSHDNTLQRDNLLRRDQIWFTQKRPDGSTDLFPLTDFHPRNDLAIDKAYLDGRFGAVPILPDHDDIIPSLDEAA